MVGDCIATDSIIASHPAVPGSILHSRILFHTRCCGINLPNALLRGNGLCNAWKYIEPLQFWQVLRKTRVDCMAKWLVFALPDPKVTAQFLESPTFFVYVRWHWFKNAFLIVWKGEIEKWNNLHLIVWDQLPFPFYKMIQERGRERVEKWLSSLSLTCHATLSIYN